jgi:hypothetical protein
MNASCGKFCPIAASCTGNKQQHVIPAQAGIHAEAMWWRRMDSRVRGNDGGWGNLTFYVGFWP